MGKVVVYTINGDVGIKDYNNPKKEKEIKIIVTSNEVKGYAMNKL